VQWTAGPRSIPAWLDGTGVTIARASAETPRVSSIAGARYREALFNSWDKNDPKDASVILALLKQGITQRYVDPLVPGITD